MIGALPTLPGESVPGNLWQEGRFERDCLALDQDAG
jgi:hypothetical protein